MRPGCAEEVLAATESAWSGDSNARAAKKGMSPDAQQSNELIGRIIDPIWHQITRTRKLGSKLVEFSAGETIVLEGDADHRVYILLDGKVEILRGGDHIAMEHRQGTIIGEVAALTGVNRTSTVKALTTVRMIVLNAAELELLAASFPALAIRLMKCLAERLARESKQVIS